MTVHDPAPNAIAADAIRDLRANVAVPFERAQAMPKSVYTSPAFAEAEQRHIFAHDWLCAGRAEALPNPGDYLTMNISGEPIIVLRDRDGVLRAMSNVCRHRMSTLLEGRGTTKSIVCPYHAWTYELDGRLSGLPDSASYPGIDKADDHPHLHVEAELRRGIPADLGNAQAGPVRLDPRQPGRQRRLAAIDSTAGQRSAGLGFFCHGESAWHDGERGHAGRGGRQWFVAF